MPKSLVKTIVQHTSCLNCGKLVFDKALKRCPKCGGHVVYINEEDLSLMGRHRPVMSKKASQIDEP